MLTLSLHHSTAEDEGAPRGFFKTPASEINKSPDPPPKKILARLEKMILCLNRIENFPDNPAPLALGAGVDAR